MDLKIPSLPTLSQRTREWQDSLGLTTEQIQRAAANHEAGHAGYVLTHAEDIALIRTGIETSPEGYVSGLTICLPATPNNIRQVIILIGDKFAGEVGEEILGGQALPGGSNNDHFMATQLAKEYLGPESPFIPQVLATAKTLARYVLGRREANLRRLAAAIRLGKQLTAQEALATWNQH